jgi:hypothetical protein
MGRFGHRTELLVAACLGLLLVAVFWSAWQWRSSRDAAQTAAENLQVCRRLAARIAQARQQPARAATQAQSSAELASRLEEAAQVAELPEGSIVRIDPQPSRRVGDSSYTEQPTHVELRSVSLEQLIVFLHRLADGPSGLQASSLRLTTPRDETAANAAQEPWLAELTLTYFIFAPKTPPGK